MRTPFDTHSFNSQWLGKPFGISFGSEALLASREEIEMALKEFDYLEVRCPIQNLPAKWLGPTNGLIEVDTQVSYSVSTLNLPPLKDDLEFIRVSDGVPIDTNDFVDFSHERYCRLPGIDIDKVNARYKSWGINLSKQHPSWCATLFLKGDAIGYIFGEPDKKPNAGIFTLASLSRNSTTSGLALYLAAMHLLKENGCSRIHSSFSARNIPALNAHSLLPCRFQKIELIYFGV